MRDDRRFAWNEIAIEAAILNFLFLVPVPARFLWATEAWMHHHQRESSAMNQRARNAFKNRRNRMDILYRQHTRGGVKTRFGKKIQIARIANMIVNIRRSALPRGIDQISCGVNSGYLNAQVASRTAEHSLP